jgi:hypothetical protein
MPHKLTHYLRVGEMALIGRSRDRPSTEDEVDPRDGLALAGMPEARLKDNLNLRDSCGAGLQL